MMQSVKLPIPIASFALVLLLASHVWSESSTGQGFQKFFKERVRFSGFVENVTGFGISHGTSTTTNSPAFNMNRLTFQPEINIDFGPKVKSFISWRFVWEPRYSAETKSRKKTVRPAGSGGSLPASTWSEFKGVPWETVLDYLPTDRLQFRIGRQFISWGETDGLRILDVINPRDGTIFTPAAPNVFNLDETRVPQWGLRMWYTVRPVSNTIFEFFANPGFEKKKQRVDENMGANDSGDGSADGDVRYGRWSVFPEDRIVGTIGRLFADPAAGGDGVTVLPLTRKEYPNAGDNWKIGARITHNFGALNLGLGYIWGFNPQGLDRVFKKEGDSFLLGAPSPFTPSGVRLSLVEDRTSIFAGHFNYPLGTYFGIPIKTAVRGEMAFYPSKPFNISTYSDTAQPGPAGGSDSIIERNNLRWSLGFDRTTFIPFLHPDDPWRAFRMSFQIFQSVILGHKDGIRNFFNAGKIDKVQTALTFRVNTGYLGDTILPDLFLLYEPLGSWVINPSISYAPSWDERLKFTLTAAIYDGNRYRGFTGFFEKKDSVFFKMRYQF